MPGKRILLVDYDPKSLTHTREVLEGAGFDVSTCGDGLAALDQYKSLSPDLVLLSAMLPKMHGFEVCSNIRKLPGGEKTPVVIITDVYKGKRYRIDAINKYGATEYIEKPIEDTSLVEVLKGFVKENTRESGSAPEDLDERTVQFSRDMLSQMVKEVPIGGSRAGEKKIVNEKPKSKDRISKKLEESLAGLELEVNKKAKEKGKEPSAGPSPTQDSGLMFTSEDLFTDVIASVERELQSEKIISGSEPTVITAPEKPAAVAVPSQPEAKPEPVKAVAPQPEPPRPKPPEPVKPAQPATAKKASFDAELEKKLSITLSGLIKESKETAHAKPSSAPAPIAKPAELPKPMTAKAPETPRPEPAKAPEPPKVAEPVKPQPVKTAPAPAAKVQAPPPPKSQPVAAKPVPLAAAKEVTQEGINFGQYLLLSKIATGGMAELFKAKRKGVEGFEKILAIKRILPHMSDNEEFVTMFIDEAKLAAQLTHHNICQIFDLGKIENSYYIAMEYVHGRDLRAVMKAARAKNIPIPVELSVLIISKICSALDYAHRKRGPSGQPINLVHRDVSPQNILISYEGEVKLVDFGIAKAATKVHVTQNGTLKGKLLYMSPEQAWGRTVDKRTDVFSLGVVLYELLTGRPLFFDENDTEVTILEKVREAKVPPVREYNSKVPQELEKIVSKALRKNPDDRYQVAFDMQKDLDNLFYTEGFNATSGSLANFVRSLFPEEWGLEGGAKETPLLEKEAAKSVPVGASVDVAMEAEAKPAAQAPQPKPTAKEQAPSSERKRTEVPFPPKAEPVAERHEPAKPSGFREITAPGIMRTHERRNFPLLVVGIIAAVLVGAVAFFFFRPKSEQPVTPPTQIHVQPPAVTNPPQETPEQANNATPAENQLQKAEEDQKKKQEEEQKKLAEQKATEDAKKQEEDRKKAELAKLQEEQKQAQQQKEAEAKTEPPAPPPQEKEETKVTQVQTPPPQPVQEPPKQEPELVKEPPKNETPVQPSTKEGDLVELTPDVVKPELLSRVNPTYPPAASAKRIEGTVILNVLISESGNVADVKVLRAAGGSSGLNEAAMTALRKWKFRPAVKDGKRVKVWVAYPIVFKLH